MTRRTLLSTIAGPLVVHRAMATVSLRAVHLPINLGNRPVASFQNGFLVVHDIEPPLIEIVDIDGVLRASLKVSVPGAAIQFVADVAVSPQQTIVTAVSAKTDSGQIASLLLFLDFT